jgi:mannose-6-phosphate isomerase-like protein (cupin superfamily)
MNPSTRRRIKTCGLASLLLLIAVLCVAQTNSGGTPATSGASQAMSARYEDLMWQAMVPELGDDSPQISILRVDSKTNATQLLIRTPKKMHVPIHWHSANETHTMIQGTAVFEHAGKRAQLGPGGFNYIPAKMQHQAWTSDGAVVFITVDGAWNVNWVGNPPSKTDLGQTPPAGLE